MRSRVYVTVGCPSVRQPPFDPYLQRPADRIHRLIAGAGAQQQRGHSMALSSKCEQCRVQSQRTRLNTDLLTTVTVNDFNIFHLDAKLQRVDTQQYEYMMHVYDVFFLFLYLKLTYLVLKPTKMSLLHCNRQCAKFISN